MTKRIGKAVKDRTTVEIENRVAKRSSGDKLDSNFWRHKKTRERHMTIEESYVPEPINCPVRVVSATGNSSKFRIDENMGWAGVVSDLKIEKIGGSHLELFEPKFVDEIVQATEIFLSELDDAWL